MHDWNNYFCKIDLTSEEIRNFNELIETNLEDLLKVMTIDLSTNFSSCLIILPPEHSLCELVSAPKRYSGLSEDSSLYILFSVISENFEKLYPKEEDRREAIVEVLEYMDIKTKKAPYQIKHRDK